MVIVCFLFTYVRTPLSPLTLHNVGIVLTSLSAAPLHKTATAWLPSAPAWAQQLLEINTNPSFPWTRKLSTLGVQAALSRSKMNRESGGPHPPLIPVDLGRARAAWTPKLEGFRVWGGEFFH